MKKTILMIGLFMLLVASLATAQINLDTPRINISLLNQDPDPVSPGRYVELRFLIQNTKGNSVAKDFQVKIEPEYPFSLFPGEIAVKNFGDLPATGDGKNVLVVKFKVQVDGSAIQGTNQIKVAYRHAKLDWATKEIDVNVQTVDANLAIVSIKTTPEKVEPGDNAKLDITVENLADSTMKDITLKLDLTFSGIIDKASTVTAADSISAFNNLPFAPLDSATEQKIYQLSSGERHTFKYNLISFTDAKTGVYKIPIEITYYDELETKNTKNDILGVIVGGKPDMTIVLDSTDLTAESSNGDVNIKFVNKGFIDVKFLNVKLAETDDYDILSSNEVYVGNVDSDDFESADFTLFINSKTKEEKSFMLPLTVEYRDDNNVKYSENINLELKILKGEKLGQQNGQNPFGLVFVIVIIGAAVIYWRRKKKKK